MTEILEKETMDDDYLTLQMYLQTFKGAANVRELYVCLYLNRDAFKTLKYIISDE